jgi:hypothetical protein
MLGTAVALAIAIAAPASAAGCWAGSCTGRDPVATGCANGSQYTIDSVTDGALRVNLRYSPACYAVWAQAVGNAFYPWGGAVQGYTSRSNPYPAVEYIAAPPDGGSSYSLMVGFNYWTKACIAYADYGWGTQACTGFH